jgi:hypothetical protein
VRHHHRRAALAEHAGARLLPTRGEGVRCRATWRCEMSAPLILALLRRARARARLNELRWYAAVAPHNTRTNAARRAAAWREGSGGSAAGRCQQGAQHEHSGAAIQPSAPQCCRGRT